MRSANSVSIQDPSANQGESSAISRNGNELETLIEDFNKTKERVGEESGECELRRYIKEGECKDSFILWEKCMDETEKNKEESDLKKCKEVRLMFKACMYDNPHYYEPILAAEAKVTARASSELQAEKEFILAAEAAAIAKTFNGLEAEKEDEAEGSKKNE